MRDLPDVALTDNEFEKNEMQGARKSLYVRESLLTQQNQDYS